jgi:hypothetical protein
MLVRDIITVCYEQLTKQIHPAFKIQNAECIKQAVHTVNAVIRHLVQAKLNTSVK